MAYNTPQYRERLRAHCSRSDIERWKAAAAQAGARNLSEWVRWVLDKEAAVQSAASRNPWVDRRTGKAKQLPLKVGQERRQKAIVPDLDQQLATARHVRRLYEEATGL